jgi:Doubled CXXCH motif (Paired_CXXCH_1)
MATRRGSARTILPLVIIVAARAAAQSIDSVNQCVACHPDQLAAAAATGGHSSLVNCLGCHAERRPNRVGRGHRTKPNCSDCHTEQTGHPPRKTERQGVHATRNCLACHDVHGSTNLHLVKTDVVRAGSAFPITFTRVRIIDYNERVLPQNDYRATIVSVTLTKRFGSAAAAP